jgi:hypothetical protein
MFFGKEPKLSKHLVTTPPQTDIKNTVTFFVYLEPKVTGLVPFAHQMMGLA